MPVSAEIYSERDRMGAPLGISVALHGALFALLLFGGYLGFHTEGESWGGTGAGGGDAMSATLVSAIPLPAAPDAKSVLATESKGLSESLPKQQEQAPPEAIPIPSRDARKADRTRTLDNKKPAPVETASNIVPYGQGGPVGGFYSTFSTGNGTGGIGTPGGNFGSRYSWYVSAVQRRISENWMKYEVDPRIAGARRVYVTFDINRDGSPSNIQLAASSGVPSLDESAKRAIQRIDRFNPLPSDYSGSKVSVEFYFDYKR